MTTDGKKSAASHPVGTAGRRILIADDHPDTPESWALLLEAHGYQSFIARTGTQALELALSLRPGAILLDIGMPGLNGEDVCRRLREEPWAASTLIIAVTGWSGAERRATALAAGCDHYLIKPVEEKALRHLLDAHFEASTPPT